MAASYSALLTPFGSVRPPPPRKPPAPGARPGLRAGSVMPFFRRHSRSVAKRPDLAPRVPPVVGVVALALAVEVVVEEVLEELPHAASTRPASTRTSIAVTGLLLLL